MKPRFLMIGAVSLMLVPAALAGGPHTEVAAYAPGAAVCPDMIAWWGHGSACFDLEGSESSVNVVIEDASGLAVHGTAVFRSGGETLHIAPICGGEADLAIPAGADRMVVYLDPYWSTVDHLDGACGTGSPTTFGTVTAHFT